MPKVSVIIPVYNVEKYLGECLDSIFGQTLKDIEVVCVDDGSTDGSAAILREYAAKDPRLSVLRQENAGPYVARRRGLEVVRGEYTYFMDADDRLETSSFERLCAICDKDCLDQIVFESDVICDPGISEQERKWGESLRRYYSVPEALDGKIFSGMELMTHLIRAKSYYVGPPLRLIRTSVIKDNEYGFPDARSRADNYFTSVSLYYSARAAAVKMRCYVRRVRPESVSTGDGAEARHCRNALVVLAELSSFPPFAREMADPKSAISAFVSKLAYLQVKKRYWCMHEDERRHVVESALAGLPSQAVARLFAVMMIPHENERRASPARRILARLKSMFSHEDRRSGEEVSRA